MKSSRFRSAVAILAVLALFMILLPGAVQADVGYEGGVAVEAQTAPMLGIQAETPVPPPAGHNQGVLTIKLFAALLFVGVALLSGRQLHYFMLSGPHTLLTLLGSSKPFYIRGALAGTIVPRG